MQPLPRFESSKLYDKYDVTIKIRERICGGVPRNKSLIEAWVKAGTGHDDATTKAQVEEITSEMVDEVAESSWIGFIRDAKLGLVVETRCVKAMLRECFTVLRVFSQKRGSKDIYQHALEVKPVTVNEDGTFTVTPGTRLPLGREKPDGTDEKPIHVMTPQGPRTALKRVDYVTGAVISFRLWVLETEPAEKRRITEDDVVRVLTLAQEDGLGADRSQQQGKFDVVHFKRVE